MHKQTKKQKLDLFFGVLLQIYLCFPWMVIDGGRAGLHSYFVWAVRQKDTLRLYEQVNSYRRRGCLSRGFFYKNHAIRGELDRALECQVGMVDPRRSIINHAMDQQIQRLQKTIAEQKQKIERLEQENVRLKKTIDQKSVNFLKNL